MNKNIQSASNNGTPTTGFFVAIGEETDNLKKQNVVNESRSGVFYHKTDLITTLAENPALKCKDMHIVEIQVPEHLMTNSTSKKKFGIMRGHNIPIISITPHAHTHIATEVALA